MTGLEIQNFLRQCHCKVDFDVFTRFYNLSNLSYEADKLIENWKWLCKDFKGWFMSLTSTDADAFVIFVLYEL